MIWSSSRKAGHDSSEQILGAAGAATRRQHNVGDEIDATAGQPKPARHERGPSTLHGGDTGGGAGVLQARRAQVTSASGTSDAFHE